MRAKLLASTAVGIVLGGILFNSPGAQAVAAVVTDPGSYSIIAALQSALTTALTKLQDKLYDKFTNIGELLSDKLSAGFTQQSNYAKAAIGAQQQMADANNTVMTTFQRDVRNAGLRDEHTMSPAACVALNMGQAITVSAGQSWRVGQALAGVSDPRGEGGPGTPAFAGQGQAAAAITQLHRGRYCSQVEATAGLCSVTPARENLDQRAISLLGVPHYDGQQGVDAANDFGTNLTQPIPPAALRGDALTSVAGQDAQARRRSYNARMSLARHVVNDIIATRTDSVTLTAEQKQQQTSMGLQPTATSSWYGALELEVYRRVGGVDWAASLQAMTPKAVSIELAHENRRQQITSPLANFKVAQQKRGPLNAALLASAATNEQRPISSMPSPQVATQ